MVVLFLLFWGNFILFSEWLYKFTYLPTVYSVLISPPPCQHLLFSFFLFLVIALLIGVRCSLWFWCVFPWWLMMLSILSCACWSSLGLIWKTIYLGLQAVLFLMLNCKSHLCILDVDTLLVITFANLFSHSVGYLLFCWWFPLLCNSFWVFKKKLLSLGLYCSSQDFLCCGRQRFSCSMHAWSSSLIRDGTYAPKNESAEL